ncbi:hypothetical protein CICLE_v10023779mg, partial [Citrus x clementina]
PPASKTKKRRTPILSSNWSDLNDDILISILARLSPLEIICASMVCSSWNRIAPWLLLPSETEEARNRAKIYKLKNRVCKDFGKWRCIGSSHGWLILLDHERSCPFLLNPFSSTRILLPPPETIADIVGYLDGEGYYATPSSHPYLRKKYGAIVIYNNKSKLAFWKHGEVTWHNFNGASQSGTVEAWDFKQHVPAMLMRVTAPLPGRPEDMTTPVVVNSYVVESLGSILLAVSFNHIIRKLTKWTESGNEAKIQPSPVWIVPNPW